MRDPLFVLLIGWVALVFLSIPTFFLISSIKKSIRILYLKKRGIYTTATIMEVLTEYKSRYRAKGRYTFPVESYVFKFNDPSTGDVMVKTNVPFPPYTYAVSDLVNIYYNPKNPTEAWILDSDDLYKNIINIFVLLAAIFYMLYTFKDLFRILRYILTVLMG